MDRHLTANQEIGYRDDVVEDYVELGILKSNRSKNN